MGGGQNELSGPDFEQGVAPTAIADGHTLLGYLVAQQPAQPCAGLGKLARGIGRDR